MCPLLDGHSPNTQRDGSGPLHNRLKGLGAVQEVYSSTSDGKHSIAVSSASVTFEKP